MVLGSGMHSYLSAHTVVLVGVLSILLPFLFRILSSPWLLLVFSPLLFSCLFIAFFALLIYLGHVLDTTRQVSRARLVDAARPLAFSTPAAWQAITTRSQWSLNESPLFAPLFPPAPQLSNALNDIISLVVRDFVQSWYQEISSSPSFPQAVKALIHHSLGKMIDKVETVDIPAFLVRRLLPKVTAHIEQFRQSEIALRGADLERRLTQSEELDLLLANKYAARGSGKLHPAIENLSTTFTRQTEEMHLRKLIGKALPSVLPETEANSGALTIVVREILVCAVLYPVMEMISDPDFWNQSIDKIAGAAIHQQKLISKIRNVLESQSPRTHQTQSKSATDTITIRTDIRQFESFLRSINKCTSLLDARRLKNDIIGEIRRTRLLLANHDKDDWINGEKTEDVVAFLDRLYTAKRKVEERIVVLGGGDSPRHSTVPEANPKSVLTLRDILSNPSSLSYFMEFMDRRHRSLLVQFWLTVESFKNPLESVDSDSSADEGESIQGTSNTATAKEDISMIHNLYFSSTSPHPALAFISSKYADVIRDFAQNESEPSPAAHRRVRRCVLLVQRQVERAMEQDFENFERSDLWFRAMGDADFARNATLRTDETWNTPTPLSGMGSVPQSHPLYSRPAPYQYPQTDPATAVNRSFSSGSKQSLQSYSHIDSLSRPAPSNIEVLMSPVSDPASDSDRAPLFNDPEDDMQRAEEKRMEAIHAALTDIVALDQSDEVKVPSPPGSRLEGKTKGGGRNTEKRKRKPVFDDEPEESTDDNDSEEDREFARETFQLAGPGDLQLSYEIARLGDKIFKLQTQDDLLNNLLKKAELTGDAQELRLLKKSKAAIQREIKQLHFQKTQYEQQEAANRLLSDRTRVSIVSSTTAEEAGKSVVRYLIEVQQLAADGSFASGWVVARRYNEFLSMHNKLRERFVLVRNLDFPGKRLVTSLTGSFLDTRKVGLEKYLQNILSIPLVCESEELRSFLSRDSPFVAAQREETNAKSFSGTDLVRTVYKSVAESIDDMFFGPSMLDVMIQRLTRQAAEFAGIAGSGINDEDYVAQALNATGKIGSLLQLPGLKPLDGETSTSTFSEPICDLILAVFELDKKNNWLRRQAIVIILQQVFGETIERKIRDKIKSFLNEASIMPFVNTFRNTLWPCGQLKPPDAPRSLEEKLRTREEANKKLSSLLPDLAANMIGRSNARRGARRMFAVLQNRRLNQHIAYTILDEVIIALFPELSENPAQ